MVYKCLFYQSNNFIVYRSPFIFFLFPISIHSFLSPVSPPSPPPHLCLSQWQGLSEINVRWKNVQISILSWLGQFNSDRGVGGDKSWRGGGVFRPHCLYVYVNEQRGHTRLLLLLSSCQSSYPPTPTSRLTPYWKVGAERGQTCRILYQISAVWSQGCNKYFSRHIINWLLYAWVNWVIIVVCIWLKIMQID